MSCKIKDVHLFSGISYSESAAKAKVKNKYAPGQSTSAGV